MTPNSNHEVPLEGFDGVESPFNYIVQPISTATNQPLQFVSQHVGRSQEIGLHSSDHVNANSVGVSGMDGGLHSSGSVDVNPIGIGISGIEGGRDGSTSSSNPNPPKKKNCYNPRQTVRGFKKQRLIWTQELHQCFLEIIRNCSPNEKAVPKKILEKMRERFPYVTRENIASHLQKHRLHEKKMKNKDQLGSSAKFFSSSSKSLPLKVTKKSNFQSTHNFNISNSTNPNSQQILQQRHSNSTSPDYAEHTHLQSLSNSTNPNSKQIPLQSHSISTNPNSHQIPLQSHSFSTNPNSHQIPLQSHSFSTNPNSHQIPLQSHSFSTNPNSHQIPLQSHSFSTNPNSHQIPLQSHSFSTNPNSHQIPLQSHSFSTNPNSHQIPLQSPSFSTNPNSQQIPLQSHTISTTPNSKLIPQQNHNIQHSRLQNNQLIFHQTHLSDQTMMQQPSFNNNVHGGVTNIYSNTNVINVCESQENPNWAAPRIGQSSNNAARDFSFSMNHCPPPTSANQISNVDAYGHGNGNGYNGFQHMAMGISYGGFNNSNDHFLGAHPNFAIGDYNMNSDYFDNRQVDCVNNMYALGRYYEAGYPLNINVKNELQVQREFGQTQQSIFSHPNRHLDDVSTMPQTSGSHHLQYLLPELANPRVANPRVEQLSNFTSRNESSSSKQLSNFTPTNESSSSNVNPNHSRRDGNGPN